MLELSGRPASLKTFVKDRPGHDYRYSLDTKRLRQLGWVPRIGFREGLRATVDWYRNNEAWWPRRKSAEFWTYYRANYLGLPASGLPR